MKITTFFYIKLIEFVLVFANCGSFWWTEYRKCVASEHKPFFLK